MAGDVMAGDLYWDDILVWSERQAHLLRRASQGERVNELDWDNLIDEVESVGRSQLQACESLIRQALLHLLKLAGWPASDSRRHWQSAVVGFLNQARRHFTPSMAQRIDLPDLYREALAVIRLDEIDGRPAEAVQESCPFGLTELLEPHPDPSRLAGGLAGFGPAGEPP